MGTRLWPSAGGTAIITKEDSSERISYLFGIGGKLIGRANNCVDAEVVPGRGVAIEAKPFVDPQDQYAY